MGKKNRYSLKVLYFTSANVYGTMQQFYRIDIEADGLQLDNGIYKFYNHNKAYIPIYTSYYPIQNTIIEKVEQFELYEDGVES